MRFGRQLVTGALVLGMLASMAPTSDAGRLLRPGTRAAVYEGAVGVGVFFGYSASFVLHNSVSYHFSGNSSGPALGGDFDIYLGGAGAGLVLGPRFTWDFQLGGSAIYVSPFLRMGLGLLFSGGTYPAFNLQFGARVKFILNNRGVLFIQPLGLEIAAGSGPVVGSYHLLFGYGATF